ncbi:hypothetical protein ABZ746_09265 [Streptomyces sp. NPDC020096]
MSGQNTSYQKLRVGLPVGAVNDWLMEELPLVGKVPPTCAA